MGFRECYLKLILTELELTEREKRALYDFYAAGKISQPAYQRLEKNLQETLMKLEMRSKKLYERMRNRAVKLESHINFLKRLLSNLETHCNSEEIDRTSYAAQREAITSAINVARKELERIKDSLSLIKLKAEDETSEMLDKVFSYLEKRTESSLHQIARDLNLEPSTVRKVLEQLERLGKVKLLR